jgi:uncharacterized membrane protein YphA (DoxX/SURF4 family)
MYRSTSCAVYPPGMNPAKNQSIYFSVVMCAYWIAHGFNALFPIENGGELAALHWFVFLYFSARGSGAWRVFSNP